MVKLWGATYVIGETSKWANAHPDRANARYGWEKAIVLETVVKYRWYVWRDNIERTQISLTSLPTLKINCRTNQGTSEGSETSADEYLTRRIRFFFGYFCSNSVFPYLKNEISKMNFTKIVKADLNSPCRDLSNSGLRIVTVLSVFPVIDFACAYTGRAIQLYRYADQFCGCAGLGMLQNST